MFTSLPLQKGPPNFHGHPGTPLRLLLNGVHYGYLAVAAPANVSPSRFTAQHLPEVLWLSKMLATLLHLLSFWAIFAVSRALLANGRAAFLGSVGYASSFPVLYYLSRVSVEPLMVCVFAASFLAIWRYEEHALVGRRRAALGFAGLTGAAAISGVVSKLQLLGPLPLLLAAMILADLPRRPPPQDSPQGLTITPIPDSARVVPR